MKIGIVGGTGELGRAMARAWLDTQAVAAGDLMVSGRNPKGAWPGPASVAYVSNNSALADWADVIVLSVPPALVSSLGISVPEKLVISVMAGIDLALITQLTGAKRVIRAMSSPAASRQLAFSPWFAGQGATAEDKTFAAWLLGATGETAEVTKEEHLDSFTAITGPVPGFVALFADSIARHAMDRGIAPAVVDLAVRQLFYAAGVILKEDADTPGQQAQAMLDYAGTTAAGIQAMRNAGLDRSIAVGLDAATQKAQEFGKLAGQST